MAAETTFWIKFRAQVREARKGYKEIGRQQKALDNQRKKQLRFERRAAAQQISSIRKVSREKERASRRQMLAERGRIRTQEGERRRVVKHQQQESRQWQMNVARDRNRIQMADREVRRSVFGRVTGGVVRGAAFAGAGMIGMLIGGALAGYGKYQEAVGASRATVGLGIGYTSPTMGRGGKLGSVGKGGMGQKYGYNAVQTQSLMAAAARATGVESTEALMRGEAYGMPTGQMASFMGAVTRGGSPYGGRGYGMDPKTFELGTQTSSSTEGLRQQQQVLAKGFLSGLKLARMPEMFQSVQTLMEQQMAMTGGKVTTTSAANVMALLGASGAAGLQGARGGKVAAQLQQGIMRPGGGEAGQEMILQAFGYGRPGGDKSYYEALKMQQQGFDAADGKGLETVIKYVMRTAGSMEEASIQMGQMFGTNLDVNEKIMATIQDTSLSTKERMQRIKTFGADAETKGKSVEEQVLAEAKKQTGQLQWNAEQFNLSVKDGATAAEGIKELVKLQRKLFNAISEQLPKFVEGVEKLSKGIDDFVGFIKRLLGYGGEDKWAKKRTEAYKENNRKLREELEQLKAKTKLKTKTNEDFYGLVSAEIEPVVGAKVSQTQDYRTSVSKAAKKLRSSAKKAGMGPVKWIEDNPVAFEHMLTDVLKELAPKQMTQPAPATAPATAPTPQKGSPVGSVQSGTQEVRVDAHIKIEGRPDENFQETSTTSVSNNVARQGGK
jgi:hypothetical protein